MTANATGLQVLDRWMARRSRSSVGRVTGVRRTERMNGYNARYKSALLRVAGTHLDSAHMCRLGIGDELHDRKGAVRRTAVSPATTTVV